MQRLVLRLLAYGALGFATTVLTAWSFALRTDWHAGPRWTFDTGQSMLQFDAPHQDTIWTFSPVVDRGVMEISARTVGPRPAEGFGPVHAERAAEPHEVPSWSVMRRGDARGVFNATYLEHAFGYPMLAMKQQYRWPADGGAIQVDGWPVPPGLRTLGRGEFVPIRLIWIGALVDTALYAWLWFAMVSFPGIVRRSIRRLRGTCPGCGYDLSHAPHQHCPECGVPVVRTIRDTR